MKAICIIGKGGAGKTTVALNLASSLQKLGKDVVVVDANLKTPNLGLSLGISSMVTLNDVLNDQRNINESVYIHKSGLRIIPSSILLNDSDVEIGKLKEAIKDLKVDFVIIDAPNLSYDAQEAIKASDEVLVVANPDHVSIADSLKAIKFAEANGAVVIGILLNKTGYLDMPVKRIEEILEKPIVAKIPENIYFKKSLKMRVPFVNLFPRNRISKNFEELARVMTR